MILKLYSLIPDDNLDNNIARVESLVSSIYDFSNTIDMNICNELLSKKIEEKSDKSDSKSNINQAPDKIITKSLNPSDKNANINEKLKSNKDNINKGNFKYINYFI